eukprot:2511702-Heterocapsa_arctica.AAC.1
MGGAPRTGRKAPRSTAGGGASPAAQARERRGWHRGTGACRRRRGDAAGPFEAASGTRRGSRARR